MSRYVGLLIRSSVILMVTAGCSGKIPDTIGVRQSALADCPKTPNCVSTEALDGSHKIDPFRLKGDPGIKWPEVIRTASSLPRSKVIKSTDDYVHLECRSLVFRFVDDLELYLTSSEGLVSIRSAARLGKSDFGVNRERVELLRKMLKEKDIIE